LRFELLQLLGDAPKGFDQPPSLLARGLPHQLRPAILFGSKLLNPGDELAPLLVQLEDAVEVVGRAPAGQGGAIGLGVLSDGPQIEHALNSDRPCSRGGSNRQRARERSGSSVDWADPPFTVAAAGGSLAEEAAVGDRPSMIDWPVNVAPSATTRTLVVTLPSTFPPRASSVRFAAR